VIHFTIACVEELGQGGGRDAQKRVVGNNCAPPMGPIIKIRRQRCLVALPLSLSLSPPISLFHVQLYACMCVDIGLRVCVSWLSWDCAGPPPSLSTWSALVT
jgi:hypothetical protein